METANKQTTPLFKKIVPARGAAQKAAATLKEQTRKRPRTSITQKPPARNAGESEADVTDDDSESADDDTDIDTSQKRKGVESRGLRTRGRGRGKGTGVRGRISQKSTRGVSPSPTRGPSPIDSDSFATPQKRPRSSTLDDSSKRTKPTTPRHQSRISGKPNASASLLTASPSCRSPSKYANIYVQNDVVWVRLNSRGALAVPPASVGQLAYWWPAQVTSDDPLEISTTLLGDDGRGNTRHVNISSPDPSTVLSFRDGGRVRFSPSTFALPDTHTETPDEVSTVEVPSELVRRWTKARDQALEADVDDELPEAPSLISLLSVSGKAKKQEGRAITPQPRSPASARVKKHFVAPLDEEIKVDEVDGELVLASDHKGRLDHWPARVVGVHQDNRTGKWFYEIVYVDGKRKKVERNRFFSSDEDGFATCQLGQWRTEFPASDTEVTDSENEIPDRYNARSPSPSPSNSDIDDIIDCDVFRGLSLKEQMRYVYPFLCRVIRREYEPSYERHDMFMKGGKAREQLGQAASMRGQFSENEVKKVSLLVRRTMLRNERWAERVQDGDDVRGGTAPLNGSDEAKAQSVAESMHAPSSDLDAATALTELKSSDVICDLPLSSSAPCSPEVISHPEVDQYADHPSSQTIMTEIETNAHSVLPSSTVLDPSSDMELESDEDAQTSLPRNVTSSHLLEAPTSPPPDLSAKEILAPSVSRMRPKGCDAYEYLSRSERGLYCADVLFPEAMLQLHLLRAGQRRSVHLLTPKEENALYEEGQELLSESVHWITQIVQMRQLAENNYKKRAKKKEEAPVELVGGTSTRPKARKVSQ